MTRPFTYRDLPRCPKCRTSLAPMAALCTGCGAIVFRARYQPKQRKLHDLMLSRGPDAPTKLGFGGSRGSSKSRFGRDFALETALSNEGLLIYVVARNLGNLEDNYIKKYRVERPDIMQYFRASPRPELNLPNNSTVAFRYADNKEDMTRLERGPEAYLVICEQAEQFSEEELKQITKPNRWPNVPIGATKTLYLFNPGGPGSPYLRRVFFLEQYEGSERPSDFAFIQSFGWDNWAWFQQECPELTEEEFYALPGDVPVPIDGKYDDQWLATVPDDYRFKVYVTRTSEGRKYWGLPPSMRMGDLFGRFDQFAGQYFAGVWDERSCVLSTEIVDELVQWWWVAWMSLDLGFGHHSAAYWFCTGKIAPSMAQQLLQIKTQQPLDIVIVYREFVEQRLAESDLGRHLVRLTPPAERKELRRFVTGADTNIVDRYAIHSRRELIEQVTGPAGFPPIQNGHQYPGTRVINARLLYEGFRRASSLRSGAEVGQDNKAAPPLFISAECPEAISTIPILSTDDKKPDDVLKLETMADDCFDSLKLGYAEYLSVREQAPREVRRQEEMDKGGDNTAKYIRMIKFDHEEAQSDRRVRRR